MQEHFLKNMDNKSYNKQREIASLSYPPRSSSDEMSCEKPVFMRAASIYV